MKLVDFFNKRPGTGVTMLTRANAQVVTYVVFVRMWTSAGPLPFATWHPSDLENGAARLVVSSERGYDFMLKASIRSGGGATMDVRFEFSDGSTANYPQEPLPISEGPVVEREWSLIVQGGAS